MANWVTLANGVHIDLDDPNNPLTGRGSFSNLGQSSMNIKEEISKLEESKKGLSLFSPQRREIQAKIDKLSEKLQQSEPKKENKSIYNHKESTAKIEEKRLAEAKQRVTPHKESQFKIIQENNPMRDDYHTGIRRASDIKTASEAFKDSESFAYPDWTEDDAQIALQTGRITIYSSKPIEQGGFISPSKMMAQDYAGSGKVYSKTVNLKDVAWINGDEGQYAKVS